MKMQYFDNYAHWMNHCIAFHECVENSLGKTEMMLCSTAVIVDSMRIYARTDNSRAVGEDLSVIGSLVIQPAYLWLWVIRFCEVLAASLLMATLYVPFQLADERNRLDISMETFNDPLTRQHVMAETCSSRRHSFFFAWSFVCQAYRAH